LLWALDAASITQEVDGHLSYPTIDLDVGDLLTNLSIRRGDHALP
jgi:hypothetical protein